MLNNEYISRLRGKLFEASENDDLLNLLLICERITRYYKTNEFYDIGEYAKDMYRVGTVYLNTGRAEKAISILKEADDTIKTEPSLEGIRVYVLNNLAIAYINNNENEKAIKGFKEAIKIKKLISGEDNEQYVSLLCNIGSAMYDMDDYDKAIYYHFESLNKREKRDIYYADNLNFLGYDFEAKGEIENAVSYFEQAAAMIKAVSGASSGDYVANIYYLAGALERCEQYERALKYYEIVTQKFKETGREEHPYYAEALGKMSGVCVKLENYQRALILSLKAMAIVKKSMGEDHIYYAGAIKSAADIYMKIGDIKRASELYERESEMKKRILGKESEAAIESTIHLCDVLMRLGNMVRAQLLCAELLKTAANSDKGYFDVLLCLVRIYFMQENAELLYMVYETAKETEPKLSFDEMLRKAIEADTADNDFSGKESGKSTEEESESEDLTLDEQEQEYEQESIDSLFKDAEE